MYVHFGNEIQGTDAGFHFVYLWNYWICGGFYGNGFYKNGEIHMEWPISGVLENWLLWAAVFLLGTILLVFFPGNFSEKEVHI